MRELYDDIVRQWYNKLFPLFRNTLRRRFDTLSNDDIEDLYQDAFLVVNENINKGSVKDNTSWNSYIIQIGINLATKKLRRSGITDSIDASPIYDEEGQSQITREVERLLSQESEADSSLYKNENALSVLGEELRQTPDPCNSIIRLYYYDGMSMEDIATAVNFKNGTTAKSKKSQCMKTLLSRVKRSFKYLGLIS